MKIQKDERIFRVFFGRYVVSRFRRNFGRVYDSWDIGVSEDKGVDWENRLTFEEAKKAKSFFAGAEIRMRAEGEDIIVEE